MEQPPKHGAWLAASRANHVIRGGRFQPPSPPPHLWGRERRRCDQLPKADFINHVYVEKPRQKPGRSEPGEAMDVSLLRFSIAMPIYCLSYPFTGNCYT